ncbi:hypothetical protein Har1129_19425 [Haloarcula sp. CBA1129]|nr:hypothetical protein Har1129_19425 [Haloarcula sp. CBA1129]
MPCLASSEAATEWFEHFFVDLAMMELSWSSFPRRAPTSEPQKNTQVFGPWQGLDVLFSFQNDLPRDAVSRDTGICKTEKGKTRLADTGVGPTGYIYRKHISLLTGIL